MARTDQILRNAAESLAPIFTKHAEIDPLMRRFFKHTPDVEETAQELLSEVTPSVSPKRDFDTASDLLDRASQAFDLLINRYQRLEREFAEERESAQAQALEQADAVEQWKRLASNLKAQFKASEKAAAALQARCDAAEARAMTAERRAASLERASAHAISHAALAEQQSIKLHDKVVTAFGIGSRVHPVLEAVATRPRTK